MVLIFLLLSCGRNMGIDQGRKEIQEYLYLKYKKLFKIEKIEKIEKGYNPDLFHEQLGFKIWLSDTMQIKFGPIFFEKNEVQHGWITYGGSNIVKEYKEAQ